jgi:hypothetical protein
MTDPDEGHKCLVGRAECGCLWGVTVLDGHDADAYKDAAGWAKKGARIETMTVAEFKRLPLHCAGHPEGRWDSRGRTRPAQNVSLGL